VAQKCHQAAVDAAAAAVTAAVDASAVKASVVAYQSNVRHLPDDQIILLAANIN